MDSKLYLTSIQETHPEFQEIVTRIASVIEGSGEPLVCAVKWGQLTYAKDGDFHHWIAGIKVTRKFVGLVFHFGGLLDDPNGLLISCSSKFGRKIEYRRLEEVDEGVILDFLKQALGKLSYFKQHWREIQDGTLPG